MVSNPLGRFDLSSLQRVQDLILVAAGTGLTPMIKIMHHFSLLRKGRNPTIPDPASSSSGTPKDPCGSTMTLLFFNRTMADVICKAELDDMAEKDHRPDLDVKVHYILSQPPKDEEKKAVVVGENGRTTVVFYGHINEKLLSQLLVEPGRVHPQEQQHHHARLCCICGPIPFNREAKR